MNVLRSFKNSVAFCDNFANFSDFQKFMFFSGKTSNFFLNQFLNVSRTFTISVAFYDKIATFTDSEIIPFFEKSHHFLGKKWTFWEIVKFAEKSHPTTILLSLAMLKTSCFFWKTSSSFSIKIDFGTFWEILPFLSHFTANLLNSAQFFNLETIFPKTHLCFEKTQNLNILRSGTNSVAFYGKFVTFSSL